MTGMILTATCSHESSGAESPRDAVDRYLGALRAGDEGTIRRISEPSDANDTIVAEIKSQLDMYGGKPLVVDSVDFANSYSGLSSSHCDAMVLATLDDRDVKIGIHMQERPTGGWLIAGIDEIGAGRGGPCKE